MGAQARKILRAATRMSEALDRIMVSGQELNTTGERVRTALAGNTGSGLRRRAKQAIARAALAARTRADRERILSTPVAAVALRFAQAAGEKVKAQRAAVAQ